MPSDPSIGRVLLVGAGPGPADLMTVRAQKAVQGAQALLYDALVSEEVIALAPPGCFRIQTGKRAGRASMAQESINRLMLRLARRGLTVVRLKGGDPSIFGRVGEEVAYLRGRGVTTEVVPGVTAACAAAAQFDIPLTHRGVARRVLFATARTEGGALVDLDWSGLADGQTTLALYMGKSAAGLLAKQLIAGGLDAGVPAAAIENAGAPSARLVHAPLEGLAAALGVMNPQGPVLILIGEVAAHAVDALATTDPAPLTQAIPISLARRR
ncbi:MAG: uroporphyrinogen-III C-methyltransferase [Caulobacter sp.]|nr:uroporphyrinogen-III C-methyltransferase [Caulobacter sp.]